MMSGLSNNPKKKNFSTLHLYATRAPGNERILCDLITFSISCYEQGSVTGSSACKEYSPQMARYDGENLN